MSTLDALSPDVTIQGSPLTASVVAGARTWVAEGTPTGHCVLIGPRGSGRTHFLDALSGVLSSEIVLRMAPTDTDWAASLDPPPEPGSFILIDDVDGYDGRFWRVLFQLAKDRSLRLCASTRAFDGRLARLWESLLGIPTSLRLAALHDRPEDVAQFLQMSLAAAGLPGAKGEHLLESVELIVSLRLKRGFVDLVLLVRHLLSLGYDFSHRPRAAAWIDAHQRLLADATPSSRVILVEGESDATYFRWIAMLALGRPDPELAIEPCGSAAKVAERSVSCRNEGRSSVALFDFDRLGQRYYEDLRSWGHQCLTIPPSLDPLQHRASDHLIQIVEIEDLLPIVALDRFHQETGRTPELEISIPAFALRRVVPSADSKLELARWVAANLGRSDAERLLGLYNELRTRLSLGPLEFARIDVDSV